MNVRGRIVVAFAAGFASGGLLFGLMALHARGDMEKRVRNSVLQMASSSLNDLDDIAVAANRISVGQLVTTSDVVFVSMSEMCRTTVTKDSVNAVIGKKAKESIGMRQPITWQSIKGDNEGATPQ